MRASLWCGRVRVVQGCDDGALIMALDPSLQLQIDEARNAGDLWNARVAIDRVFDETVHDADLWAARGELLVETGDTPEGGRWLFFSGVDDPSYQDAVQVFLEEHPPSGQLFDFQIPGREFGRPVSVSHLPSHVQERLVGVGYRGVGRVVSYPETSDFTGAVITL